MCHTGENQLKIFSIPTCLSTRRPKDVTIGVAPNIEHMYLKKRAGLYFHPGAPGILWVVGGTAHMLEPGEEDDVLML